MKTRNLIAASLFIFSLLDFSQAAAQKESRWIGGHPGQEQNWDCPQNWSGDRVPDEFSNVFIEDISTTSLYNPVIQRGDVAVNSLFIESNATLTVAPGSSLTVHTYLTHVTDKSLRVKGWMQVMNEHLAPVVLASNDFTKR